MGKVILLTGPPGVGKSTLRRELVTRCSTMKAFDYGELLRTRKLAEGSRIPYEALRHQSAALITPHDVKSTDESLISEISRIRATSHVIIDSHALTAEEYGFRAVPFSTTQLNALELDAVLALRCDPTELVDRVSKQPAGRRELNSEQAREIQMLQEALCLQYCVACSCPLFIVDTTQKDPRDVARMVITLLCKVGITFKNLS